MGRAPCCDKANVKKGPWSPEEDAKLKAYIEQHGTGGNWIALPQKIGLKRCGKSCRLRWLNYLRPNIKHGGFSEEEDNIICSLYISIGSRWSIIAAQLPGRTDNDIKNYWNTRLKKKLLGKHRKEIQSRRNNKQISQEMKKGSASRDNYCNNYNNNPYWSAETVPNNVLPPIPYSNEEPRFNDHTSIRKLLIKLGGRFSSQDDDDDDQLPINPHYNIFPAAPEMISSAPLMDNCLMAAPGPEMECNYKVEGGVDNVAMGSTGGGGGESSNFAYELEQMIYNNPQKFEGLEFLCGDIFLMNNYNNNYNRGDFGGGIMSSGWSEMMSSMVLPSSVVSNNSNYEDSGDDHLMRYNAGP